MINFIADDDYNFYSLLKEQKLGNISYKLKSNLITIFFLIKSLIALVYS